MFTFPQNVDQLVDWVEGIASAAPNTPCLYYHIPSKTKVECKLFVCNAFLRLWSFENQGSKSNAVSDLETYMEKFCTSRKNL